MPTRWSEYCQGYSESRDLILKKLAERKTSQQQLKQVDKRRPSCHWCMSSISYLHTNLPVKRRKLQSLASNRKTRLQPSIHPIGLYYLDPTINYSLGPVTSLQFHVDFHLSKDHSKNTFHPESSTSTNHLIHLLTR